jgi:GTP cyclohydrolase II
VGRWFESSRGRQKVSRKTLYFIVLYVYWPSLDALHGTPLVRINCACFTGDIFGDRRSDCTEQLYNALNLIKGDEGIVTYQFHHEGRGLG